MSLLNIKYKSDLEIRYGYPKDYVAQDIVALSDFDSIISYNAIKAKISNSITLYNQITKHRSKVFR